MKPGSGFQSVYNVHPGEWYFGAEYQRVHTVLGSCVALTAWHPTLKVGGLCHYLLARAPSRLGTEYDCRYGVHALRQMHMAMKSFADPQQFHLGLFGGGDMFASRSQTSIGKGNIAFAKEWLAQEGLQLRQMDVGGTLSRSLVLMTTTGDVELKRYEMNSQAR